MRRARSCNTNTNETLKIKSFYNAVLSGNRKEVLRLTSWGVDVNLREGRKGFTPLHAAVFNEDKEMVRTLLSFKGIDVNKRDYGNKTPIAYVLDSDSEAAREIVQMLKKSGAVDQKEYFEENQPNDDDGVSEGGRRTNIGNTDVVEKYFLRKLMFAFSFPFVILIFVNGFFFALKFILVTLLFYFIISGYFLSELTIKPPWYHHTSDEKKTLTLKGCPDYWDGMLHNPMYNLKLPYEDVTFFSADGYRLSGWYVPGRKRDTSQGDGEGEKGDNNQARVGDTGVVGEAGEKGEKGEKGVDNSNNSKNVKSGKSGGKGKSTNSTDPSSSSPSSPCPSSSCSSMGLVFVHGGGRDRRAWLRHLPMFVKNGYSCLLFDFREHGLSDGTGKGFRYGMVERFDVIAACNYMRDRYQHKYVAAIGTSVGGSSVIMAAALEKNIDVIVAENPVLSAAFLQDNHINRLIGSYFSHNFASDFMFRIFRSCCSNWLNWKLGNKPSKHCQAMHVIGSLSPRPVLLMHGTYDEIVPPYHSELLYEKAKEPKELWICPQAVHCNLFNKSPQEYEDHVISFIRRYDPSLNNNKANPEENVTRDEGRGNAKDNVIYNSSSSSK